MSRAARAMAWVAFFAIGAVACWALPCRAQVDETADAGARRHFEAGTEYFRTGDYEDALREFRRAHEMSGRPALLYNIASAEERLGHFAQAAEALAAFLEAAGPEDPSERSVLEARLANMRRRAASAVSPPPGGPASGTPTPVVEVPPVVPTDSAAPRTSSEPILAIAGFGVAGAGLVVFAVLGGLAFAEDDALASRCASSCSDADVAGLGALALGADIGAGVAAAAAIVGLVGLFVDTGAEPAPSATLGPWLTPSSGGVSLRSTF